MTDVNNLTFKGNVVNNVTFKGNAVTALNYGDLHWSSDTKPFLNSWLVGADTGGSGANNLHPINGQQKERIEIAGGVVLALIVEKASNDTIELAWSVGETSRLGYRVEDWGFILMAAYGGWSGGSTTKPYMPFNIHSVTDPTIKKEYDKGSGYDENNIILFDKEYTSKTFRISSSGGSITEVVSIFPYTFYDYPNRITINDVGIFDPFSYSLTPFTESSQDIINNIDISDYDDLTHILSISFNANNTGKYRFISLYINNITLNFIQEYNSTYRVYFNGAGNYYADYIFNPGQDESYKYMFSLSDSVIVKDKLVITTDSGTRVCLPSNITNEFNVTYSNEPPSSSIQTQWGNTNYNIQYFSQQTEITFTKK